MSYRYRDSGEGDRRVRQTRTGFKEMYLVMLGEMDSDQIQVSRLAERADISRKAFYLHYSNLSDLRDDIADDMARSLSESFNGDLEHDILTLYEFLDEQDAGVQKLFTETGFRRFYNRFCEDVFREGAFGEWEQKASDPSFMEGYLTAVLGIYTRYNMSHPAQKNLKKLARNAAKILFCGISGGVQRKCVLQFQISGRHGILPGSLRRPAMAS